MLKYCMRMRGVGLFITVVLCGLGWSYFYYTHNRWVVYYQRKLQDAPRDFVIEALKNISTPNNTNNIALDLGSSVGHETLLLLQKNYEVYALDHEKIAFDMMLQRPEFIQYKNKVHTVLATFQDINFGMLPQFDLVLASFSLPFCLSVNFTQFWMNVTHQLKLGGYFIGNTFDPSFMGFTEKDRKNMTFHTKEETLNLFQKFKIINFQKIINTNESSGIVTCYYVVVAQKIAE